MINGPWRLFELDGSTHAEVGRATMAAGVARVPGDKSVSHRALILGAVAGGETLVTNLAPGEDVRSTARVLRALGACIEAEEGSVRVYGRGFDGLREPTEPLDCGNSGTTMRLLLGVLAGRPFGARLIGDASLTSRPMRRVTEPLCAMGGSFVLSEGGRPPVEVRGRPLRGVFWSSPVASAQVKSAILLAGLQAGGSTTVCEPALSRDHTERMLAKMGAAVGRDGTSVTIFPGPLSPLGSIAVPGDLSSAAFLLAAGLLLPGPGLSVRGVGINPTRTGFLQAVEAMGAEIDRTDCDDQGGEPTATLIARRCALGPLHLGGDALVRAIDEVPLLAVLATQARGRSVVSDASELRVKESDRLAATARFLAAMGARIEERPDGLVIDGPCRLSGTVVDARGDHRIAMAAAVAGLVAGGTTRIEGAGCVAVSYPSFFSDISMLTNAEVRSR